MDSRHVPLSLLLALALLFGWLAGCSGPSPLTPNPPGPDGSCSDPLPIFTPFVGGLTRVGTDTTLDLATWNLEFFPLRLPGNYTCPHPIDPAREQKTADLINLVGLDVIAVEEISDPIGFGEFLTLCPDYGGLLSPEVRGCNYQRPGIIYRKDQVTIHSSRLLFTNDSYAFPRSPFQVDLTITSNARSYDLHLIVVHLKASGDTESQQRRRLATTKLKGYLDEQAAIDSTTNYMVAGDWNDVLEDPLSVSSFPDFLKDPGDYHFLDLPMAGLQEFASLGGVILDHLMVNRAACSDFSGGRITTFRFDALVSGYNNVSDHRPVVVQAPIFTPSAVSAGVSRVASVGWKVE